MVSKAAVRKAVAQVVDRPAIAHKVYKDTVEPLYSMVPKGLTGHTTGFFDDYGDPSATKARKILTEAGISTPSSSSSGTPATATAPPPRRSSRS